MERKELFHERAYTKFHPSIVTLLDKILQG